MYKSYLEIHVRRFWLNPSNIHAILNLENVSAIQGKRGRIHILLMLSNDKSTKENRERSDMKKLWTMKFNTATLVLIPAAIGINYLGKLFAGLLKLPLWLDSIGTCLAALLAGPIAGAIVGAVNNIIYGVTVDPISTIYALTVFALIMLFKHALIAMFVSENLAEIEEYATIYLFLCGTCFTPLGMIFIYRNILQGCGYALIPTMGGVVELVSRAVVAVIAASRHSFTGVCVANMGAWVSAGIFLFISYQIIFYRIAKKEHSLQSPKAENAQT